ncbi:MAG: BatD family protein [Rhodoferax sp.]|uniref:BatD family protein n=3 Tax=Rhodoferax sp. TaxID=50421 RepID=UPI00326799E9
MTSNGKAKTLQGACGMARPQQGLTLLTSHHAQFHRSGAAMLAMLAMLCALGAPLAAHAAVQAAMDRQVAGPGESITLSIVSDAVDDGVQPDLTPLDPYFQVLDRSTSSATSITNGRRSSQMRWDIRLQPKQAGHLEIPPITVGVDRTEAMALDVQQASPAQLAADEAHAFLEVDANTSKLSPYVQQQVPYAVKLFFDSSVIPEELELPKPENAAIDQLGADKKYTAVRNGRTYQVIERDYAISPEKSGPMVIAAPIFRGKTAVAGPATNGADPDDDLIAQVLSNMPGMRSAFGAGSPFGTDTRPIESQGRQITLNVKPRPAGFKGDWLPAEDLTLQDSWAAGAPSFKVGEPVTRVITLQAKGVAASQIPTLSIATPANARIYPETPVNQSLTDGQVIYGNSKQSVSYIPTQTGPVDIPAIDITWWDVVRNAERHTTIPALHLQVAAGAEGAQSNANPPVVAPASTADVSGVAKNAASSKLSLAELWPFGADFGAALLAVLALLTAYAVYRHRDRAGKSPTPDDKPAPPPNQATLMRALRQACEAHTAPLAAEALMGLARLAWPNDPPRGLGTLAARLEAGGTEIRELDRCLYGGGPARWTGTALWQALQGGLRPVQPAARPDATGLDPLYPATALP